MKHAVNTNLVAFCLLIKLSFAGQLPVCSGDNYISIQGGVDDTWCINTCTHTPRDCPDTLCDCASSSAPTKRPTTTSSPTPSPTPFPTPSPTTNPTHVPTNNPTQTPITTDTWSPTQRPTISPTKKPTSFPTVSPTKNPTAYPTYKSPSNSPTPRPHAIAVQATPTLNLQVQDGPTQTADNNVAARTSAQSMDASTSISMYNDTATMQSLWKNPVIWLLLICLCLVLAICLTMVLIVGFRQNKGKKHLKIMSLDINTNSNAEIIELGQMSQKHIQNCNNSSIKVIASGEGIENNFNHNETNDNEVDLSISDSDDDSLRQTNEDMYIANTKQWTMRNNNNNNNNNICELDAGEDDDIYSNSEMFWSDDATKSPNSNGAIHVGYV